MADEAGGGGGEGQPDLITNQTPELLLEIVQTSVVFVQTYGWFLLIGSCAFLYFKPMLKEWLQKREEQREEAEAKKNPDKVFAAQQAMDAHRLRLQQQVNINAVKQKEEAERRAELKRLQKIDEWEKHQKGEGYHSKTATKQVVDQPTTTVKSKKKNVLRPSDYNPLTGQSGSSSGDSGGWRPSARGGNTGGG